MDNLSSSERQFADLEALQRKLPGRSVGILWAGIAALPESFEPDECAGYFRCAGYGSA